MKRTGRFCSRAAALSVVALATLTSAAGAPEKGLIHGTDQFEFVYRVKLPELASRAQLWMPLAKSDAFQTVKVEAISAPGNYREVQDRDYANRILLLTPTPDDSGKVIEVKYSVRRAEKSAFVSKDKDPLRYLERLVPINETFKSIAEETTRGKADASGKGRVLYDHVLAHMQYDKTGTGWGRGDAVYACDARAGNCTDFHAYFVALARSIGIPARFAIGYTIPADDDEGEISGYHCWAEFFADGKWVPVDISEASKHPELADYYFGHHPANRFELTQGRDLVVEPAPASSPINFLVYPLLEVNGKTLKTENAFSFRRIKL